MNKPQLSLSSLVRGTLLSLLVYLLVAGVLVVIVQAVVSAFATAAWPMRAGLQGGASELTVLWLDLLVQAVAASLAGAVALRFARDRWEIATAVMGGSLMLALIVITIVLWRSAPPWFNIATLVTTWPFVALGAAWRGADASRGVS